MNAVRLFWTPVEMNLFDFRLKRVKLRRRKELAYRDPQAVTDHFDRNHLGVLAFSIENVLYA